MKSRFIALEMKQFGPLLMMVTSSEVEVTIEVEDFDVSNPEI